MSRQGYVLGPTEGEHLIRNAGNLLIKVDPTRGSNNMALGTQQVPIRAGIPVHQHHEADEVLFVLEGSGIGIVGDMRALGYECIQFVASEKATHVVLRCRGS